MKLLLLVLSLLFVSFEVHSFRNFHNGRKNGGNVAPPTIDRRIAPLAIAEEWFTQDVDHFTPTDQRKWQQRYYSNDQFFDPAAGGPAFLFIGGEGSISEGWMRGGNWVANGITHGALLFQVEHRFYGESHPTEDVSNENLRYLTSEQALADLATFIVGINEKYNLAPDTKWIAFGGSYSGSLAAWLRFKYPHLVHAAVSSSGPLLAEVDFQEYLQVVEASLSTYSDECVTVIGQAYREIDTLLGQQSGPESINDKFNLCTPIDNASEKDLATFYEVLADNFAGVVQYNKISGNITIDTVCEILVDNTITSPVDRLAAVSSLLYGEDCVDYSYDEGIQYFANTSWDGESASDGWRQWMYQTCNEFGFYQTSTAVTQTFGDQFPVAFFIDQCRDIYGDIYDEDFLDAVINRTNIFYGGLDIEESRVVYVHGSIDPWHALGILETVDQDSPAIFIEGTAHCADMYTPSVDDTPEMVAAHDQIAALINSWLGDEKK